MSQGVRRALGWSLLNNAAARFGSVAAGIVIARLLSPADFGVYAVALLAMGAIMNLNDLGVNLAIIRDPRPPAQLVPTVLSLSAVTSLAMYGLSWLAAPALAGLMHAPAATGVLRLLCLTIIIDAVTIVPASLLTRNLEQGARAAVDVVALVVGLGLTVVLAATGMGAYSLAVGRLAGNAVTMALFPLAQRRTGVSVRFGWDAALARELVTMGLPAAAAGLVGFATLNIDTVLVGQYLGPALLGVYVLAFNLAAWPVNMFSTAVSRVAVAGFAKVDTAAARDTALAVSLLALLAAALPVATLLALAAGPLVEHVYGARWHAAAGPLRVLAAAGAARVVIGLVYDRLLADGRTRAGLGLHLAWLAALSVGVAVGVRAGGVVGAAVGVALAALVVALPLALALLGPGGRTALVAIGGVARVVELVPMLAVVGVTAPARWVWARRPRGVLDAVLTLFVYPLSLLVAPVAGPAWALAVLTPLPVQVALGVSLAGLAYVAGQAVLTGLSDRDTKRAGGGPVVTYRAGEALA